MFHHRVPPTSPERRRRAAHIAADTPSSRRIDGRSAGRLYYLLDQYRFPCTRTESYSAALALRRWPNTNVLSPPRSSRDRSDTVVVVDYRCARGTRTATFSMLHVVHGSRILGSCRSTTKNRFPIEVERTIIDQVHIFHTTDTSILLPIDSCVATPPFRTPNVNGWRRSERVGATTSDAFPAAPASSIAVYLVAMASRWYRKSSCRPMTMALGHTVLHDMVIRAMAVFSRSCRKIACCMA